MLQLRFINDSKPPMWLVAPEYTFGSSHDNDCTLTQNSVAAQHAKIVVSGDEITLHRVADDVVITHNGSTLAQSAVLSAGDTLCLGEATIEVADPKTEKRQREVSAAEFTTIRPALTDTPEITGSLWFLRPLNTTLTSTDRYELTGVLLLGRSKECDICIPASHLSRKHARFSAQGGSVKVEDLKSSNGTFVNGSRVEKTELKHGDEVGFDTLKFRVESAEQTDDATTLRPALDETQIRQAVSNTQVRKASPTSAQRKAPPVRPKTPSAQQEEEGDSFESLKLIAGAAVVVGAVAGLVWFLLT